MEATLKFTDEERKALSRAVKADELAWILWEMSANGYRKFVKHSNVSEEYEKGVEDVLKWMHELCEENDINLDYLVE